MDGVSAELDVRTGCWLLTLDAPGTSRVREWTWGERRRTGPGGSSRAAPFHRDLFLDGLLELLTEPAPPDSWRERAAFACLQLLGVPGDGFRVPGPPPLAKRNGRCCNIFGWLPVDPRLPTASVVDKLG